MSGGARRAASLLVAGEIALAGILLVGAGLTLRSFANLIAVDPGFRTDNVLTRANQPAGGALSHAGQRWWISTRASCARSKRCRMSITPAPAAVIPLTGNNWTVGFDRVDRPVPAGERPPDVGWQAATAGYFRRSEIPLQGRAAVRGSRSPRKIVPVIISEAIAHQFFPGEDPIGLRLKPAATTDSEIVGVVGDIRRAALTDQPRADMYFPVTGQDHPVHSDHRRSVERACRPCAPRCATSNRRSSCIARARLSDMLARRWRSRAWRCGLLAGFAIVALVLAAIGIYGVMAYSVRRRTREIGTRVALGANRGDIIRLVMREGGVITIAGVVDRPRRRPDRRAIAVGDSLRRAAGRSAVARDRRGVVADVPAWRRATAGPPCGAHDPARTLDGTE